MTEQIILVKYECQHPSCQVNCKKGELAMEESLLTQLSEPYEEKGIFKSPRGVCRMGFAQPFKVVSIRDMAAEEEMAAAAGEMSGKGENPIDILMEEHKVVLKNLDLIEEQISKRDIDGLWLSTSNVENEIMLHSITKEEEVLFPLIKDMSLGEGLIAIVHEDHRELLSLLHTFRNGLREGNIYDGIAHSVIANLRSHIQKEDGEFFAMVDNYLDETGKKMLLAGMAAADKAYVPAEAGERCVVECCEDDILALKRKHIDEAALAIKDSVSNQCGSCH